MAYNRKYEPKSVVLSQHTNELAEGEHKVKLDIKVESDTRSASVTFSNPSGSITENYQLLRGDGSDFSEAFKQLLAVIVDPNSEMDLLSDIMMEEFHVLSNLVGRQLKIGVTTNGGYTLENVGGSNVLKVNGAIIATGSLSELKAEARVQLIQPATMIVSNLWRLNQVRDKGGFFGNTKRQPSTSSTNVSNSSTKSTSGTQRSKVDGRRTLPESKRFW